MCRHFVPPIVQIGLHHRDLRIGLSRLNALYAGMTGRLHILILRRMVPGQWLARLEACSLPKTRSIHKSRVGEIARVLLLFWASRVDDTVLTRS
jgi:hypothetical protein